MAKEITKGKSSKDRCEPTFFELLSFDFPKTFVLLFFDFFLPA